jgi:hypothetical protein
MATYGCNEEVPQVWAESTRWVPTRAKSIADTFPTALEFSTLDSDHGAFKINQQTGMMTVNLNHPLGQMWVDMKRDYLKGNAEAFEVFLMAMGKAASDISRRTSQEAIDGDLWCPHALSERMRHALDAVYLPFEGKGSFDALR